MRKRAAWGQKKVDEEDHKNGLAGRVLGSQRER